MAYLIEVLVKLAESFEDASPKHLQRHTGLTREPVADRQATTPPLPDFSRFAARFRREGSTPDGDIRAAYFESYRTGSTTYAKAGELAAQIASGTEVISAGFVTPYPPGFPILVPGQVITSQTLDFMAALDTKEIHGFDQDRGYLVFKE